METSKDEVEEGQIVEEWKTVSMEKASRCPKSQGLQYGQVRIATPSSFTALSDKGENQRKWKKKR